MDFYSVVAGSNPVGIVKQKGRSREASRDGSLDPGRDVGWTDDVRADRNHESIEPRPRSRV